MFNKVKVLSAMLVLVPVLGMASTSIKCPSAAAVKKAMPWSAKKDSTGSWDVVSLIPDSQYDTFIAVPATSEASALQYAKALLKTSEIVSLPSRSDSCTYVGLRNHYSYKILASKK